MGNSIGRRRLLLTYWQSRRPAVKRRVKWAIAIVILLAFIVIALLAFADSYAIASERQCAPAFLKLKWPMWIGCALTAHEDLAAGLIGAAGALFAAWLAFDAIQEQIGEEKERRAVQQIEAKAAAVMCITPAVHASAATLAQVNDAINAQEGEQAEADELVQLGARHLDGALDTFTVRESLRDLGIDDRVIYLSIVGTLMTFINLSFNPSPRLTRIQRLKNQRRALMNVRVFLRGFDDQLSAVYERDSKTNSIAG